MITDRLDAMAGFVAAINDGSLAAAAPRLSYSPAAMTRALTSLERNGTPATPSDLAIHAGIMSTELEAEPWSFAQEPGGRRRGLQAASIQPRLIVNAAAATIDSAIEGHGITRGMSFQVAEHVAAGRLVLMLETLEAPSIRVHFVMHASRAVRAKQRAFIGFTAPALRVERARKARMTAGREQLAVTWP